MKHISLESGRFAVQLKELEIKYYPINPRLCWGNFLWIIANEQYQLKHYHIANAFYKLSGESHKAGCKWLYAEITHNTDWDHWGYRIRCINGMHWMELSKAAKKGEQLSLWLEPSERWMHAVCNA